MKRRANMRTGETRGRERRENGGRGRKWWAGAGWGRWLGVAALAVPAALSGQNAGPAHMGFIYPAGGQQGTVVEITAGGQFLRNADEVLVTGPGVRGEVVAQVNGFQKVKGDYLRELGRRMSGRPPGDEAEAMAKLPPLPALTELDHLEPGELREVAQKHYKKEAVQRNRQIDDRVLLRLTIDPGAEPGPRELRLRTALGLTNPLRFVVSDQPEQEEREPNDGAPQESGGLRPPFVLNGQVLAGDVDRVAFQAEAGQTLVFNLAARALIPYLADAVPGWFQATLALRDAHGREIAFADDYRFEPDPVLFYRIPRTGMYEVEIRDALFRGREDFVYRLAVGETAFITGLFPLGGTAGKTTEAALTGWNLPTDRVTLGTGAGDGREVRQAFLEAGGKRSNSFLYAVDARPSRWEEEPNDAQEEAQPVPGWAVVDGILSAPGEADWFAVEGREGETLVAEVWARRLHSPVDSLLRLFGPDGKLLDWNDDQPETGLGLLTHHADSLLRRPLPVSGTYRLQVTDAQGGGGPNHAYRLRLGAGAPDFVLRVSPSSLTIPAGRAVALTVQVERLNGFTGPVDLEVDCPLQGFRIEGGPVPAGSTEWLVTLTAPALRYPGALPLHVKGRAWLENERVERRGIPAEAQTQAFMLPQSVDAQALVAILTSGPRALPPLAVAGRGPVEIAPGGQAVLQLKKVAVPSEVNLEFELAGNPAGLQLTPGEKEGGPFRLILSADEDSPRGAKGNLVVLAFARIERQRDGQVNTMRVPLGALPAVPYSIHP